MKWNKIFKATAMKSKTRRGFNSLRCVRPSLRTSQSACLIKLVSHSSGPAHHITTWWHEHNDIKEDEYFSLCCYIQVIMFVYLIFMLLCYLIHTVDILREIECNSLLLHPIIMYSFSGIQAHRASYTPSYISWWYDPETDGIIIKWQLIIITLLCSYILAWQTYTDSI